MRYCMGDGSRAIMPASSLVGGVAVRRRGCSKHSSWPRSRCGQGTHYGAARGGVESPGGWNQGWNRSAIFETPDDVGYVGFVGRACADRGEGMTRIPFVADGVLQVAAGREEAA